MGQAAIKVGVSKSTVSRAISTGRLKARRLDTGGFAVHEEDVVEAFRQRLELNDDTMTYANMSDRRAVSITVETLMHENKRLREDIAIWRAQVERLSSIIDRLLK
jgi:predicted site-specific integrase-resolvase